MHTPEEGKSIAAAMQTAPAAMTEEEEEDFAVEDEVEVEAAAHAESIPMRRKATTKTRR